MENVDAFNNELSGLYSAKPPISKAKMAAITRAAMKAIKFYKHVVQSVEKFILKCKPEYKIPGLYVIDSIVRQSRHQFGPEKDVFAPRFARNVKSTFANLFRGVPEDKSRIIRVLNLWQKNNVFAPEVINPLFDLADPNHPIYQLPPGTQDNAGTDANGMNLTMSDNNMSMTEENHGIPDLSIGHQTANAKILDQSTLRQLQHIQQILIRQTTAAAQNEIANSGSNTGVSGGIIGSSSSSCGGGGSNAANINQSDSVKFNKKVLEYDYDEEEEHEDKSTSPHVPNLIDGNNLTQLLKDPNVLRQLQTLQQYKKQQEEKQIKLNEMRIQEEAFEKHLQNVLKGTNCPPVMPGISSNQTGQDNTDKEVEFVSEDGKIEVINLDGNDSRSPTPERYNKRRRSRSRSRGRGGGGNNNNDRDRRRRSRSRSSRSRSPKPNRRRGSSRDRGGNTGSKDKDREKERDREYERERKRKGLPETKKDHLSVCSTTLWVGHLSKLVQPEELSDSFGKYGDIVSIDMIHPRGCAFIVMNRRQDAYKAMGLLKNHKMQGRAITISWAAGKGVKSKEWKDFWDLELGVSYVPWSKLNDETDLEALEEGGMFDEDSMPSWIKEKINQKKNNRDNLTGQPSSSMFPSNTGIDTIRSLDITQPPPSAVGPLMPPPGLVPPFPMGPPVPRMMGGPMGPPGMPGMPPPGMPGIPPMPPNMMPPGMPPPGMMPHGMLPPPHGGMMAGFPTIPPPQIDKNMVTSQSGPGNGPPQNDGTGGNSGLPPSMTGGPPPPQFMGGFNMQQMLGMPPQFQQPPPQPSASSDSAANQNSQNNSSNEDQMDIEMEDDMPNISSGKSSSFNQPPPLFPNFPSDILSRGENRRNDRGERDGNENRIEIDFGGNNRNRGETHGGSGDFRNNNRSASSRWGGNDRGGRDRHNRDGNIERDMGPPPGWNENGMGNFPGPNFNDNGVGRPGMNMPPFEIPNQQGNQFFDMRHDDFNDDRRGPNNGPPRDFFPDRYGGGGSHANSGGSGPQMRGGPPQFGPRLGNIFMRGHVSRNGPHGGGGFNHNNFNDRPPFDREDRGGGGGGGGAGRNMRSGMQDRRGGGGGGRGNWRDEEDLMERGGFRRGGRFQNRDDRVGRDRDRSGGGSGRDRNQRDRNSRDRSSSSGGRNNRRNSSSNRDDEDRQQQHHQPENVNNEEEQNQQQPQDTEDDWDQELEEFNINADIPTKSESTTSSLNNRKDENVSDDQHNNDINFNNEISHSNNDENLFERRSDENTIFAQPAPTEQHQSQQNNKREDSGGNFNNTPLYDEPNEGGGGGGSNNGNSQSQQQGTAHKLSPKDKNKNSTNLNDSSNVETNFETSSSTSVIGDDDAVNE